MIFLNIDSLFLEALQKIVGVNKPRDGILDCVKNISSGKSVIISAPPGYGKTMIPYSLAHIAAKIDTVPFSRVIHILPLRTIIEGAYIKLFKKVREKLIPKLETLTPETAGMQMMFTHGSPFLQKLLVFTTIDTFTLNMAKLPTLEIHKIKKIWGSHTYGHGIVSQAAISMSAIVFDEVHLFIEETPKMMTTLLALLEKLSLWNTPLVLMTATFPRIFIKAILERIKKHVGFNPFDEIFIFESKENKIKHYDDFKIVSIFDQDFYEEHSNKDITTQLVEILKLEEVLHEFSKLIKELSHMYDRILIVMNTVRRAITVYNALKEQLTSCELILLHGKLTSEDKAIRTRRLFKLRKWIAITTQVVEAGVDISAQVLITDLAPISALIQRIGRCARFKEDSRGCVIILIEKSELEARGDKYHGIYDKELVKQTLRHISKITKEISFLDTNKIITKCFSESKTNNAIAWHIPDTKSEEKIGYQEILNKVYSKYFTFRENYSLWNTLREIMSPLSNPKKTILHMIMHGGSFTRELMIPMCVVDYKKLAEVITDIKYIKNILMNKQIPISVREFCKLLRTHKDRITVLLLNQLTKKYEILNFNDLLRNSKLLSEIFNMCKKRHLNEAFLNKISEKLAKLLLQYNIKVENKYFEFISLILPEEMYEDFGPKWIQI